MKTGILYKPYGRQFARFGNERFKVIRELGFSSVDYNICDTDYELYGLSVSELRTFLENEKSALASAGVSVSQIHGPWRWPPMDATLANRAERMEKMKKSIAITAALGAKYWVVHPLMPFDTQDKTIGKEKETREINLAFWRELLPCAKEHGVVICLENMPMLNFSLATPEDILDFVREIDDESFAVCLDTGHVAVFDELRVADEVRRLGSYIKVLHVHDNLGDKDAHLCPGLGRTDWQSFSCALGEIGFAGVLSLETAPGGALDDGDFLEEARVLADNARRIAECV